MSHSASLGNAVSVGCMGPPEQKDNVGKFQETPLHPLAQGENSYRWPQDAPMDAVPSISPGRVPRCWVQVKGIACISVL